MFNRITWSVVRIPALVLAVVICIILAGIFTYRVYFTLQYKPYKIGIIINSVEISPEDYKVVKFIMEKKLKSINDEGGINGHPVEGLYLDDKGDLELLHKMVAQALQDQNLIAFIGCNHSSQIAAIKELVGPSEIPFIGGFSITELIQEYPNIYSSEVNIDQELISFKNLLKMKTRRAAFIYKRGDLYSEKFYKAALEIQEEMPEFEITMHKTYPLHYKFSDDEMLQLADSINRQADLLVLSFELEMTNALLNGLWKYGMNVPVFSGLTDMSQIKSTRFTANEVYGINAVGIPDAMNMKLEEEIAEIGKQFRQLTAFNFRVAFGARHADAIGLIKEASLDKSLPVSANIRDRINAGLSHYIEGGRVYRGVYNDWFFTPERSLASQALLSWKPRNFPLPLLFPTQYYHTDSADIKIPVIYADLSMVSFSQVNDEEGTLFATFYLDIYSANNLTIDQLEFTNAVRNRINQEPLVQAKLIRSSKDSMLVVMHNYLYKVSGKFYFDPDLKRYPYDEQKFSIVIQSKNILNPLLIQPPDLDIRDSLFDSKGWNYHNNYVGYTHDLISENDYFNSEQKIIPYYKFSYIYEMKRAKIDFIMKTLVPLLAILLITYFSVYIPFKEFEALAAIQVTALLAAIALYFSTFKPELQNATISDKIFIFTYIMITSLIGTSVFLYIHFHKKTFLQKMATLYQRLVFPLIVLVFVLFLKY